MKKIMFNDRYHLTEMVLMERKTMTRRLAQPRSRSAAGALQLYPTYEVGEKVAIARSYFNLLFEQKQLEELGGKSKITFEDTPELRECAGFTNKMFVKANLMPDKILITRVTLQRLQDITEQEAIEEGIICRHDAFRQYGLGYTLPNISLETTPNKYMCFINAREAFRHLINIISGYDVWEKNPFVYAYKFKLV